MAKKTEESTNNTASEIEWTGGSRIYSFFKFIRNTFLVIALAGAIGGGYWVAELGIHEFSDKDLMAITSYKPMDNSIIFDRNDQKIGELFSAYYIYTPLEKIPKSMIQAVTAVEDQNFRDHIGIDIKAIIRAVISVIRTKSMSQGASTITQQLVRNLLLTREKTIARKVKEIALSILLERKLNKDKIIEIYLNALFLGNGSYGVSAASMRYFGRPLDKLEIHEHALIAGLFQSPSAYNPRRFPKRAKKRQRKVLISMARAGFLTVDEAKKAMKRRLKYTPYVPLNSQVAPYFIDYVQEKTTQLLKGKVKNRGLRIYTTLDQDLQSQAKDTINRSQGFLDGSKANLIDADNSQDVDIEAAILSTDPKSGHILAMVGGRDYEKSQFNRTVHAKRSPGSSIKPVVYSLALSEGYKWSDVVYVSPIAVRDYRPKNYSAQSYLTETTLLRAFYKSINTPAVEIAQKVGLDKFLEHSLKMGIKTPLKKEFGTTLGGSEVTMLDMARLYGTFANQGKQLDLIAIKKITDRNGEVLYEAPESKEREERALSAQVAYLMQEGLRTVFKFGTAYNFRRHAEYAVGKTGTSNKSKDNWFCGYTPNLVTVVWSGVEKHAGFESEVSGSSLALPLWSAYMIKAVKTRPPADPIIPIGVTEAFVDPQYGSLDPDGVAMQFISGDEPKKKMSNLKTISHSGSFRSIFDR